MFKIRTKYLVELGTLSVLYEIRGMSTFCTHPKLPAEFSVDFVDNEGDATLSFYDGDKLLFSIHSEENTGFWLLYALLRACDGK